MRLQRVCVQETLALFKADVDSAFRRVPIAAEYRKSAYVAFKHKGQPMLYRHNAMCFGAISSVYEWDRIGAFLL